MPFDPADLTWLHRYNAENLVLSGSLVDSVTDLGTAGEDFVYNASYTKCDYIASDATLNGAPSWSHAGGTKVLEDIPWTWPGHHFLTFVGYADTRAGGVNADFFFRMQGTLWIGTQGSDFLRFVNIGTYGTFASTYDCIGTGPFEVMYSGYGIDPGPYPFEIWINGVSVVSGPDLARIPGANRNTYLGVRDGYIEPSNIVYGSLGLIDQSVQPIGATERAQIHAYNVAKYGVPA